MSENLRVLCVDDNEDAALSVALLLEAAGCEVLVCKHSRDALAAGRDFLPDVCVLDLRMPGMNGCELASRLREQTPTKPPRCIAVTALWDISHEDPTHTAYFDEHFIKPFDPEALVDCVVGGALAR